MDSREKVLMYLPFSHQSYAQYGTPGQFGFTPPAHVDMAHRVSNPTSSVLGDNALRDTGMDVGVAVVFSVNPPSPLESDVGVDEQEAILRNWHTGGTSVENGAGSPIESSMDAHVKIEDDPNRTATTTSSSATAGRTTTSSQKSSSSSSNGTGGSTSNNNNNNKAEFFGKKGQGAGGSRRSGTGDPHRKSELYKTELCISSRYGDNCQFAHSEEELNQVTRHPRYKTQMCTSFQNQGYCKYNDRCTFIHHPEEARVPPPLTPTRRGSVPERSSWTPLGTTSNNSPAASASESRGERLRSLSDPGQAIVCSDKTERSIKGQEVIHSVIGAPSVLSQVQHVTPITTAVTAGATAGVPASEAELLGCMNEALAPTLTPAMRRPQRRMTINQPSLSSDPITSIAGSGGVGAGVGRYHQVPGYSPSLGFNTGSDVSLFGHTNTTNATHTITRLGLARRSSSAVHFPLWQDRSSPWRDNVEVDDDEQWASKLAYYISTPHNDFRI